MSDKFCVDCRHCVIFRLKFDHEEQIVHKCWSPRQSKSLVTGNAIESECLEQRAELHHGCGFNGNWFEPRAQEEKEEMWPVSTDPKPPKVEDLLNASIWRPTSELRFVTRYRTKGFGYDEEYLQLQQKWEKGQNIIGLMGGMDPFRRTGETQWRDVPTEYE